MFWYKRLEGQTFGNVLNAARRLTTIPATMDADLEKARLHRDRLAHSFFVEHAENLLTSQGRRQMIDELHSMPEFLVGVDEEFDKVWLAAWNALGVSPAWFNKQFEKIRQTALADQNDT